MADDPRTENRCCSFFSRERESNNIYVAIPIIPQRNGILSLGSGSLQRGLQYLDIG